MKALKINKSLWSLPLDFSFDSSEINELIKVMDIELQEVVISPNADMWYFLFMKEEFILVSDVDDGLDIRFFKKENEDLAKKFINKITNENFNIFGRFTDLLLGSEILKSTCITLIFTVIITGVMRNS